MNDMEGARFFSSASASTNGTSIRADRRPRRALAGNGGPIPDKQLVAAVPFPQE
jgi:hypothetical protein